VKVFKSFCLSALVCSGSLAAEQVEVIQVTEGASASNQSYDLVLMVQQLQAEVRSLRGKVESQQYQLDSLKQQQKEMYSDLDGRLGGTSFMQKPSANVPVKATGKKMSGNEQQDYSAAFAFIKSQELVKAESAFIQYMQAHPKAKRVSNALYWLGEVNLAQGKLPDAGGYFQKLMSVYPKSAKIPDAMYKLGRVYQRMNDDSKAKLIWQQLVDAYPKAAAAKLASNALK
jgi:tol-pal system protein YbgF